MKFCVNCKHAVNLVPDMNYVLCKHPKNTTNLVTGIPEETLCGKERSYGLLGAYLYTRCGRYARFYEEKQVV